MMSRNIFKETQSWIDENLKPKTRRFRTIVISYNSLPECQYDGNFRPPKGQLISKANCQVVNSSKKRTNEFVFTTMRRVFVRFLEEIEVNKNAFQN